MEVVERRPPPLEAGEGIKARIYKTSRWASMRRNFRLKGEYIIWTLLYKVGFSWYSSLLEGEMEDVERGLSLDS